MSEESLNIKSDILNLSKSSSWNRLVLVAIEMIINLIMFIYNKVYNEFYLKKKYFNDFIVLC